MDFPEAMAQYWKLRTQHEAGALSDEQFEAAVGDLTVVDAQGDPWQIGVSTGRWYRYDGNTWVEDFPALMPEVEASPPRPPVQPPSRGRPAAAPPRQLPRISPPPGWQPPPGARAGRGGASPSAAAPSESRLRTVNILIAVLVVCFLLAGCLAAVLLVKPDLLSG